MGAMLERRFVFDAVFVLVALTVASLTAGRAEDRADEEETYSAAAALVRQALEAEVAGDAAARERFLLKANKLAPHYAPARWHAGYVLVGDQWRMLQDAEKRTESAGVVAEYRALRDRHAGTIHGQIALARWCRRKQLDELEKLHWWQVLRVNPTHKEARQRLGVREYNGLLLTRQQVDAYRNLRKQRDAALDQWKPLVHRWRRTLRGGDDAQRDEALREIRSIADPAVIPLLEESLSPLDEEAALAVVAAIGAMQAQEATDSLVRHAVLSEFPGVRKAAAVELRDRSWFAYVPALLGSLQAPAELSYYVTTLTDGAHFGFTIEREGPTAYFAWSHGHRSYRTHTTSVVHDGEVVATSTTGLPDPIAAAYGSRQLGALRRTVNDANARAVSLNECIYVVLELATEQRFEWTPQAWWQWWLEYNELQVERNQLAQHRQTSSMSVSQEYSQVSTTSSPQGKQLGFTPRPGRRGPPPVQTYVPVTGRPFTTPPNTMSCFLPGTRVSTNTGPLPIEKVRRGDYVLSQAPDTGELAYRPVLETTVRPPSPTLRIGVGKEEIAATRGHPLWVVGEGWVMAKELRVGDRLHGVHGGVKIDYIEPGTESEAYNLVVADFHTFCVGQHRVLAHDNRARQPTRAILPGLLAE
jgi:hypothetical protein